MSNSIKQNYLNLILLVLYYFLPAVSVSQSNFVFFNKISLFYPLVLVFIFKRQHWQLSKLTMLLYGYYIVFFIIVSSGILM